MQQPEETRQPRRTVIIVAIVLGVLACIVISTVVAGMALFWPVRSEITTVEPASDPVATSQPAEDTPSGIDWESDMVAEAIRNASADWAAHVTSVERLTVLRRPVILVSTDIGPEQADLSDQMSSGLATFAAGLSTPDGDPYTFSIQVLSSEGDMIGQVAVTDERWKLEAAATPTDAASLKSWIDETYGSGSPSAEAWTTRITGIESDAGDADGYVVISTDLDPTALGDLRAAQTIIDAVNSSGADFAFGVRVIFGDRTYEWSSLVDGTDPYYNQ
ncbi:MAG: hypothetical protein Q7W51_01120 [Coriobacteriia bacterium]|nr:hypothetical protein [Coriobacteriia bacterium]